MYEDFYRLQAKPFRLSPDPKFFFASREHERALTNLRYGLSQGEGFVVVTGAPGTGKTTLAQVLLKEMNQSNAVVAHLTTTQLEVDDLLRMVAASFGLRYEGMEKPGLLKILEAFLLVCFREGKRILLVVDEAQNLPPNSIEELRMLSNLQMEGSSLLQIFLLGQAQFRKILSRSELEQFRQRIIANYHLRELGEDECRDYIESRLGQVGWQGDPHFTNNVYKEIYQYTQGIPRRINMICDRLMLFGCIEERHEINADMFRQVTDELQDGTSGRQIKLTDMADAPDLLYAKSDRQPEQIKSPENPGVEDKIVLEADTVRGIADSTEKVKVREEQDLRDQSSAPGLDKSSLVKKEPDYRNDKPVVQGQVDQVVLRKMLRFVMAYHRSPRSFPVLGDPAQPLFRGIKQILLLAVLDDTALEKHPQITGMGISPVRYREAVRFFIHQVMFLPGADNYRVLGLSPDATQDQVEEHYGLLKRLIGQEKKGSVESGLTRIGESYDRLSRIKTTHESNESPSKEIVAIEEVDIDALELDLDLYLVPDLRRAESERI